MKKKILATLVSAGVLVLGMLFLVAIATPKFGAMEGGRTGYALRTNLSALQHAQVGYERAFDMYVLAPPCPAGTAEPAFCPEQPGADGLGWRPDPGLLPHGRYTVERTETGFIATAEHDGQRYTIRETGEPQRAW